MVQTAVTQGVKTLNDVHQRFGLQRSPDEQFFIEWYSDLPALDATEQETLNRIRQRFRYHWNAGQVAEGAVNAIVVSRLLEMAGFFSNTYSLLPRQKHLYEVLQILKGIAQVSAVG